MRAATSGDGRGGQSTGDGPEVPRRRFLKRAVLAGGVAALGGAAHAAEPEGGGVSPAEDLMREHGVLRRLLLVYEAGILRMRSGGEEPATALHEAAGIIRDFIEQYHEKLEEDHIFPLFKDSKELGPLTQVLTVQHQAGRAVTARILAQTGGTSAANTLSADMAEFIRMYRPHAAREDTVLFPALHDALSAEKYADLGEQFEDKEHELFGASGFEGVVARVAAIEMGLGIYALDQFTPGTRAGQSV